MHSVNAAFTIGRHANGILSVMLTLLGWSGSADTCRTARSNRCGVRRITGSGAEDMRGQTAANSSSRNEQQQQQQQQQQQHRQQHEHFSISGGTERYGEVQRSHAGEDARRKGE